MAWLHYVQVGPRDPKQSNVLLFPQPTDCIFLFEVQNNTFILFPLSNIQKTAFRTNKSPTLLTTKYLKKNVQNMFLMSHQIQRIQCAKFATAHPLFQPQVTKIEVFAHSIFEHPGNLRTHFLTIVAPAFQKQFCHKNHFAKSIKTIFENCAKIAYTYKWGTIFHKRSTPCSHSLPV